MGSRVAIQFALPRNGLVAVPGEGLGEHLGFAWDGFRAGKSIQGDPFRLGGSPGNADAGLLQGGELEPKEQSWVTPESLAAGDRDGLRSIAVVDRAHDPALRIRLLRDEGAGFLELEGRSLLGRHCGG